MKSRAVETIAFGLLCLGLAWLCAQVWLSAKKYPERHARTCLVVITEKADYAVSKSIPTGDYLSAIAAADYIDCHYPVGTVVSEDHPFAAEYTAQRNAQLERIMKGLASELGYDHGNDWAAWEAAVTKMPP